ncbi:hypothetical protein B0H11DRAFT_2309784 [Mycena galericulata]|nr:hypothetical protein B0H11DRAFT_2309784 [Mycena galericulata]
MTSPLASTFGVWLVALFLESILYGMGLLQVYLYFLWYHKDSWGIKGTVILITILETFQTITFFVLVYNFLINDFGASDKLLFIPWQSLAQLTALYFSIFVSQTYFAHCIYVLHKRSKILPAIIVLLSTVALGGAIAQAIISSHLKHWTELEKTSASTNIQAAFALAADVLITGGLSWTLNGARSGIQTTNKLINFLIMNAVNRGVLTMVTALLNMVLFLTEPGTFYFMLIVLISGKLYMNSMLAMLNTREHAKSIGKTGMAIDISNISMPSFSTNPEHHLESGIAASVMKNTQADLGHGHSRDGKTAL